MNKEMINKVKNMIDKYTPRIHKIPGGVYIRWNRYEYVVQFGVQGPR